MVIFNVETDLDVANGARGVLTGILLDDRRFKYSPTEAEVELNYPPVYVAGNAKMYEGEDSRRAW
ncbi:hypothetical protein BDN67DRAFT_975354 [Paxillus ammoniavirescens]|nr:hypothetical protein BDN67DRAFT_975354 [Paxillus ammoniavirescens]